MSQPGILHHLCTSCHFYWLRRIVSRRPRVLESAGIQVIGQVGDADRLLAQVRADRPDAVVVDIRMPPTHTSEGLDAARRIRGEHAPVGVLVLSQYVEPHHAMQLLEDGASGVGYFAQGPRRQRR